MLFFMKECDRNVTQKTRDFNYDVVHDFNYDVVH